MTKHELEIIQEAFDKMKDSIEMSLDQYTELIKKIIHEK